MESQFKEIERQHGPAIGISRPKSGAVFLGAENPEEIYVTIYQSFTAPKNFLARSLQ
jgi:hypothetical protein